MKFKNLIIAALLVFGLAGATFAQSKPEAGKVSVKADEFTGKKTVVLPEVQLAPGMKMSLESTSKTGSLSQFEADMLYAKVFLDNTTGTSLDQRELEVNFRVDGQIVRGGPAKTMVRPQYEKISSVVDLSNLDKISKGRKVEMKVGDALYTLDDKQIALLKDFVKAAK